jgi:hypothetical protein
MFCEHCTAASRGVITTTTTTDVGFAVGPSDRAHNSRTDVESPATPGFFYARTLRDRNVL